jgi:hypothetical protein
MQYQQIQGSTYSSKPSNVSSGARKPLHSNGRIDILGPNIEQQFAMYDKIPNSSACSSFRDAMIGNWENTALSDAFFSTGNMEIVQNALRNGVYTMSKGAYLIGPQDCDNLKMIMRSVFLQSSMNLATNIPGQIEALNKIVVEMFVPKLIFNISAMPAPCINPSTVPFTPQKTTRPWNYNHGFKNQLYNMYGITYKDKIITIKLVFKFLPARYDAINDAMTIMPPSAKTALYDTSLA